MEDYAWQKYQRVIRILDAHVPVSEYILYSMNKVMSGIDKRGWYARCVLVMDKWNNFVVLFSLFFLCIFVSHSVGYFEGQFCEYRRGRTHGYESDDPVRDTVLSKESDTLQQDDIPTAQLWIIVVIFMILTGVVVVVLGYGCFYGMCMDTRSGTGGEVHSVGIDADFD
jgi:hypothetical protein